MSALQHGNSPTEETGRFQRKKNGRGAAAQHCSGILRGARQLLSQCSAVNVPFHGYIHGLIVRWIAVGSVHHHCGCRVRKRSRQRSY